MRLSYGSWLTPDTVSTTTPAPTSGTYASRSRSSVATTRPTTSRPASGSPPATAPRSRSRSCITRTSSRGATSPLLLYGYGSYEISYDPFVSIARLSLLDRGMVFVLAHIRGGGEMGRLWYEHGKLLEKKNTFNDYVDCAQHLIDTGWTDAESMVGLGGSAGGLLDGRGGQPGARSSSPDIVAQVPFVDALTSILDPRCRSP